MSALHSPGHPGYATASLTRVLLAVLALQADGLHLSVRSVAARAGLTVQPTHQQLQRLRDVGLVAWEPGRAGTLRPLVYVAAHGQPDRQGAA